MSRPLPPGMTQPTSAPAKSSASLRKRLDEGEPFLSARVPARIHRAVRKKCAAEALNYRAYLLRLLDADGIR
jgi:predicted DNA binding CopG/RHH family protein